MVINNWATILDKGGQVDALNFEKAFDTSRHELLECELFWIYM